MKRTDKKSKWTKISFTKENRSCFMEFVQSKFSKHLVISLREYIVVKDNLIFKIEFHGSTIVIKGIPNRFEDSPYISELNDMFDDLFSRYNECSDNDIFAQMHYDPVEIEATVELFHTDNN